MTQDFLDVLGFFGKGAIGAEYKPDHEINIEQIYKLSVHNGIWQTVYLGMYNDYDLSAYTSRFLYDTSANINRKQFIFNIINEIEKAGIKVCFLKGITVARFYNHPDCRISGDADILVSKDDLNRTLDILAEKGFQIEKNIGNTENLYHVETYHKNGGVLEVHTGLYQKHINDMIFEGKLSYNEEYTKISIDGNDIYALGINDALNHLTAHYIKHFINKGVGLRQLMDILLYMLNYMDEIDWGKYNELWSNLRFYDLIETIKGIGVKYWGMEFDSYKTDLCDGILDDIEKGGVFGFGQSECYDFLDIFLAEKNKNNIEELEKYMGDMHSKSRIRKIFPNKKRMVGSGYLYAEKGVLFLFIAYIHRLLKLLWQITFKKKKIENVFAYKIKNAENKEAKDRMELMKELNMFK